jgi:hypothetical protein
MLDLGIPSVVAQPVSYMKYNWETEHFKQLRMSLLWKGQAKASRWTKVGVFLYLWSEYRWEVALVAVVVLDLVWSLTMTGYYEKKRRQGLADLYQRPSLTHERSILGITAFILKLVYVLGIKDWVVTKAMCSLRWACAKLPPPIQGAKYLVLVVGLSLTGILSGHHQLEEAGFTGEKRLRWNRIGRLLNTPAQAAETFAVGLVGVQIFNLGGLF